jgi:hypothetical protein
MDELTKIALIGTSKYAGPMSTGEHPAAALVAGLAGDDREQRGVWLSRQNPDWSYFHTAAADGTTADEPELRRAWDEGTIDERCQVLANLRRLDPLASREWVAQVFAHEKPNHRIKLVVALENGLCDGDEEFLEACLNDRSPAVGQAAARLLCRLPRSALAGRMRGRADATLTIERKGLALKKVALVCMPPTEIARDWKRDGIPERAPSAGGQRAFWAETVLAAVPPSHWSDQFGLGPQELIAAVAEDTFAASVLAGWTQAATWFAPSDSASAEWLVPLWEHWALAVRALQGGERVSALDRMRALLPQFPPDRAEAAIVSLLESAPEREGQAEADRESDIGGDSTDATLDAHRELAPPSSPTWQTDPLAIMAEAAGYKDHELWWEEQIERRSDATGLFAAIHQAMCGVRADLPEVKARDLMREAYMRKTLRAVLKEGFHEVAVVCGAWHAPVLDAAAVAGKCAGCKIGDDNDRLSVCPRSKRPRPGFPGDRPHVTAGGVDTRGP